MIIFYVVDIYLYIYCSPFNPWPGSGYEATKMEHVDRFAQVIMQGGVHCTVRRPRGQGKLLITIRLRHIYSL